MLNVEQHNIQKYKKFIKRKSAPKKEALRIWVVL